jgi:hypothetical protein
MPNRTTVTGCKKTQLVGHFTARARSWPPLAPGASGVASRGNSQSKSQWQLAASFHSASGGSWLASPRVGPPGKPPGCRLPGPSAVGRGPDAGHASLRSRSGQDPGKAPATAAPRPNSRAARGPAPWRSGPPGHQHDAGAFWGNLRLRLDSGACRRCRRLGRQGAPVGGLPERRRDSVTTTTRLCKPDGVAPSSNRAGS